MAHDSQVGEKVEAVFEIEYSVDADFNQKMYDSCKDVTLRSAFTPAIGVMCGSYGAEFCTAQRWFEFLGSSTKVPSLSFHGNLSYLYSEQSK